MERATRLCAAILACIVGRAKSDADVIVLAPDADARILSFYAGTPDYNPEYLSVFNNAPYWPTGNEQRSLLRFGLSAIPNDQWITSARLTLFSCTEFGTNTNGDPMSIFRLTTNWVETAATWNNKDGITKWSTPGADLDAVGQNGVLAANRSDSIPYAVSTANPSGDNEPVTWDVTNLVGEWQSGIPNYGLLLLAPPGNGLSFRSKEYSVGELRPRMEITLRSFPDTEWGADGGGSWANSGNWRGPVPNRRGHVVKLFESLATTGHAPAIITLDGDRTVGALNLDNTTTNGTDPVSFIIASGKGGKLILDNDGGAAINVKTGRHIISAPVSIIDGTTVDVAASAKLSITGGVSVDDEKTLAKTNSGPLDISGGVKLGDGASLIAEGGTVHADAIRGGLLAIHKGAQVIITSDAPSSIVSRIAGLSFGGAADVWEGTLDLTNSDLIIEGTPQTRDQVLQDIANQIKTARAGGKWTGDGITSSTARDNPYTGLAVLLNYRYGSIKPLLEMFDGESVDNSCILIKYTWNGDGNVDGVVNADDYFLIDTGFVTQTGGYRNGDFNYDGVVNADDYFLIDSAFIGQSGPLRAGARPAAVPEPHCLVVLGAGIAWLVTGRRRPERALPRELPPAGRSHTS